MSNTPIQDAYVARFQEASEKARREMIAACEHYATAMQALAVAYERQERAREKQCTE